MSKKVRLFLLTSRVHCSRRFSWENFVFSGYLYLVFSIRAKIYDLLIVRPELCCKKQILLRFLFFAVCVSFLEKKKNVACALCYLPRVATSECYLLLFKRVLNIR
ncbi:hypothetical protein BD560DRAFT_399233 [Blakeslea trispora]|nr:hypothetical protein BD560DRAFT_399233 [Blakeslea trispora]